MAFTDLARRPRTLESLGKAERESSAPPSRKATQPRVNRRQEPWIGYCVLGYVLAFVGDEQDVGEQKERQFAKRNHH